MFKRLKCIVYFVKQVVEGPQSIAEGRLGAGKLLSSNLIGSFMVAPADFNLFGHIPFEHFCSVVINESEKNTSIKLVSTY